MEENLLEINITNNQGNKKDTIMLWNCRRFEEYWSEVNRVLNTPLNYYGDYEGLSGRIGGGGHYGNSLDSVVLKVKDIVEKVKDENIPVVLTSKTVGEEIYESSLTEEELNYILDKVSEDYENISLTKSN